MVQDPGKALYAGTFKTLNMPELLRVEEDHKGFPLALKGRSRQAVATIEDIWRLDDEWWRAATLARMYYAVLLVSGQRHVIFKDLATQCWYRQSY
jgi:hypothetical protein